MEHYLICLIVLRVRCRLVCTDPHVICLMFISGPPRNFKFFPTLVRPSYSCWTMQYFWYFFPFSVLFKSLLSVSPFNSPESPLSH